jgi:hypothetical protein
LSRWNDTYLFNGKDEAFLVIDKIIPDKDPKVLQSNFIILNLKNDFKMETGIIQENYNIPQTLKGIAKSIFLKLLNKDKYWLNTKSLIGIDKSFLPLINDPIFKYKISLNNYFADIDEETPYFNLTPLQQSN